MCEKELVWETDEDGNAGQFSIGGGNFIGLGSAENQ
jgi:hypothetical protein